MLKEARIDVPASLRPLVWAALLDICPVVGAQVHAIIYENLVTGTLLRVADKKVARILTAAVADKPEWVLINLEEAVPIVEVLIELWPLLEDEVVVFLLFQAMLPLLYPFYNNVERVRSVLQFLLRYVDPELSLHMEFIDFEPPAIWATTLFAQHIPRPLVFILWDQLLVEPPQYALFVSVAIFTSFPRGTA